MKKLILFALLVLLGYLGYGKYFANPRPTGPRSYSLATVEQTPIPKSQLFSLWSDVALGLCADAKNISNLTPEQCRDKVKERAGACEATSARSAPDIVSTKSLSKQLGREYVYCVMPGYFCKGVEVKTEEEARRVCQ